MVVRLDWNDIRARAALFASEWKDAHYERGDTQTFYNEFFALFGISRRRVASFEFGVNLPEKKRGYLDLFWKGKLLIEQKSKGRDLTPARKQALDYFPGLKEHELPRYLLLSDFQNFELYDLDTEPEKPVKFSLAELPKHIERFGFIVGLERRVFREQAPANIDASLLMATLHDQLKAAKYKGHPLERLLVRILFCLFADSTGIFPSGIFWDYVENTRADGADLGPALSQLFEVLDTPEDERQDSISQELNQFPYVNGQLFSERLPQPHFNRRMRDKLLEACEFQWQEISPAIFGSLFQSVMNKKERRALGAHYTSEKNILKVIEPLFMDSLRDEFTRLKARRDTSRKKLLQAFHEQLGAMKFFDPACGCGNFLVIAYRELRELEIDVLKELYENTQLTLPLVNVDQFYGIEIEEFPARIAEVAMWMTDHIMNVRLSATFGKPYLRIPLKTSPNIRHFDALDCDWGEVLKPSQCSYIFGNPPFLGSKVQDKKQRAQIKTIAGLGGSGGSLDYVAAWFIKAGEYLKSSAAKIAFVATNSITQGEQVAQLWPLLFNRYGLEISFAHRTFEWLSDARGRAHVHCVILGLTKRGDEAKDKRLYSYDDIAGDPTESKHSAISAYLFDASQLQNRHLVVAEVNRPIANVKRPIVGSKPIDGGYFIFTKKERAAFLAEEPAAKPFMRPYIGAEEFINGEVRYILALQNADPKSIRSMPKVKERIEAVRKFRLGELPAKKAVEKDEDAEIKERGAGTVAMAETPTRFHVTVLPEAPFLAIPEVSSERRDYVPIGWLSPPTIPSNLIRIIANADLVDFGLITSRMHMAWLRNIGGRLKSDYRYSIGIVYNPFPWPTLDESARKKITDLAQAVLDARSNHRTSTLADLYDPTSMPNDLRKAHLKLDVAVDRIFRKTPFSNDRERVEHLFKIYEHSIMPMLAPPVRKNARRRL